MHIEILNDFIRGGGMHTDMHLNIPTHRKLQIRIQYFETIPETGC